MYTLIIKGFSYSIIAAVVIVPIALFMNRYTPFFLGKRIQIDNGFPYPIAKGLPASVDIFFVSSMHVETVVLMTKCGSEG